MAPGSDSSRSPSQTCKQCKIAKEKIGRKEKLIGLLKNYIQVREDRGTSKNSLQLHQLNSLRSKPYDDFARLQKELSELVKCTKLNLQSHTSERQTIEELRSASDEKEGKINLLSFQQKQLAEAVKLKDDKIRELEEKVKRLTSKSESCVCGGYSTSRKKRKPRDRTLDDRLSVVSSGTEYPPSVGSAISEFPHAGPSTGPSFVLTPASSTTSTITTDNIPSPGITWDSVSCVGSPLKDAQPQLSAATQPEKDGESQNKFFEIFHSPDKTPPAEDSHPVEDSPKKILLEEIGPRCSTDMMSADSKNDEKSVGVGYGSRSVFSPKPEVASDDENASPRVSSIFEPPEHVVLTGTGLPNLNVTELEDGPDYEHTGVMEVNHVDDSASDTDDWHDPALSSHSTLTNGPERNASSKVDEPLVETVQNCVSISPSKNSSIPRSPPKPVIPLASFLDSISSQPQQQSRPNSLMSADQSEKASGVPSWKSFSSASSLELSDSSPIVDFRQPAPKSDTPERQSRLSDSDSNESHVFPSPALRALLNSEGGNHLISPIRSLCSSPAKSLTKKSPTETRKTVGVSPRTTVSPKKNLGTPKKTPVKKGGASPVVNSPYQALGLVLSDDSDSGEDLSGNTPGKHDRSKVKNISLKNISPFLNKLDAVMKEPASSHISVELHGASKKVTTSSSNSVEECNASIERTSYGSGSPEPCDPGERRSPQLRSSCAVQSLETKSVSITLKEQDDLNHRRQDLSAEESPRGTPSDDGSADSVDHDESIEPITRDDNNSAHENEPPLGEPDIIRQSFRGFNSDSSSGPDKSSRWLQSANGVSTSTTQNGIHSMVSVLSSSHKSGILTSSALRLPTALKSSETNPFNVEDCPSFSDLKTAGSSGWKSSKSFSGWKSTPSFSSWKTTTPFSSWGSSTLRQPDYDPIAPLSKSLQHLSIASSLSINTNPFYTVNYGSKYTNNPVGPCCNTRWNSEYRNSIMSEIVEIKQEDSPVTLQVHKTKRVQLHQPVLEYLSYAMSSSPDSPNPAITSFVDLRCGSDCQDEYCCGKRSIQWPKNTAGRNFVGISNQNSVLFKAESLSPSSCCSMNHQSETLPPNPLKGWRGEQKCGKKPQHDSLMWSDKPSDHFQRFRIPDYNWSLRCNTVDSFRPSTSQALNSVPIGSQVQAKKLKLASPKFKNKPLSRNRTPKKAVKSDKEANVSCQSPLKIPNDATAPVNPNPKNSPPEYIVNPKVHDKKPEKFHHTMESALSLLKKKYGRSLSERFIPSEKQAPRVVRKSGDTVVVEKPPTCKSDVNHVDVTHNADLNADSKSREIAAPEVTEDVIASARATGCSPSADESLEVVRSLNVVQSQAQPLSEKVGVLSFVTTEDGHASPTIEEHCEDSAAKKSADVTLEAPMLLKALTDVETTKNASTPALTESPPVTVSKSSLTPQVRANETESPIPSEPNRTISAERLVGPPAPSHGNSTLTQKIKEDLLGDCADSSPTRAEIIPEGISKKKRVAHSPLKIVSSPHKPSTDHQLCDISPSQPWVKTPSKSHNDQSDDSSGEFKLPQSFSPKKLHTTSTSNADEVQPGPSSPKKMKKKKKKNKKKDKAAETSSAGVFKIPAGVAVHPCPSCKFIPERCSCQVERMISELADLVSPMSPLCLSPERLQDENGTSENGELAQKNNEIPQLHKPDNLLTSIVSHEKEDNATPTDLPIMTGLVTSQEISKQDQDTLDRAGSLGLELSNDEMEASNVVTLNEFVDEVTAESGEPTKAEQNANMCGGPHSNVTFGRENECHTNVAESLIVETNDVVHSSEESTGGAENDSGLIAADTVGVSANEMTKSAVVISDIPDPSVEGSSIGNEAVSGEEAELNSCPVPAGRNRKSSCTSDTSIEDVEPVPKRKCSLRTRAALPEEKVLRSRTVRLTPNKTQTLKEKKVQKRRRSKLDEAEDDVSKPADKTTTKTAVRKSRCSKKTAEDLPRTEELPACSPIKVTKLTKRKRTSRKSVSDVDDSEGPLNSSASELDGSANNRLNDLEPAGLMTPQQMTVTKSDKPTPSIVTEETSKIVNSVKTTLQDVPENSPDNTLELVNSASNDLNVTKSVEKPDLAGWMSLKNTAAEEFKRTSKSPLKRPSGQRRSLVASNGLAGEAIKMEVISSDAVSVPRVKTNAPDEGHLLPQNGVCEPNSNSQDTFLNKCESYKSVPAILCLAGGSKECSNPRVSVGDLKNSTLRNSPGLKTDCHSPAMSNSVPVQSTSRPYSHLLSSVLSHVGHFFGNRGARVESQAMDSPALSENYQVDQETPLSPLGYSDHVPTSDVKTNSDVDSDQEMIVDYNSGTEAPNSPLEAPTVAPVFGFYNRTENVACEETSSVSQDSTRTSSLKPQPLGCYSANTNGNPLDVPPTSSSAIPQFSGFYAPEPSSNAEPAKKLVSFCTNEKVICSPIPDDELVSCCINLIGFSGHYNLPKQHRARSVKPYHEPSQDMKLKISNQLNRFITHSDGENSFTYLKKFLSAQEVLPSMLAKVLCEILAESKPKPAPPKEEAKGIPSYLSLTQKKAVLLVVELYKGNFKHLDIVLNVMEQFLSTNPTERNESFSKGTGYGNIASVYGLLCRTQGFALRAQAFIFDLLYGRHISYFQIIHRILCIVPNAMPHATSDSGPLTYTIAYIIMMQGIYRQIKDAELALFGIYNLRNKIERQYGYSFPKDLTRDHVMDELINNIMVKGSDKAIVLLCKSQGFRWAHGVARRYFFPFLETVVKGQERDEFLISRYMIILGEISRGFALSIGTPFVKASLDLLHKILKQKPSVIVTESAVSALVHFSRLDLQRVTNILLEWTPPDGKISLGCIKAVQRITAVKSLVYWKTLAPVT